MVKKFIAVLAAAVLLAAGATASAAQTYFGGWQYENNAAYLVLGNGDGYGYELVGTERYCGQPGASYYTIKQILDESNYRNRWIEWWVDQSCRDGYDRICVQNQWNYACSTYYVYGWIQLPGR